MAGEVWLGLIRPGEARQNTAGEDRRVLVLPGQESQGRPGTDGIGV
jgi:hypothetical protein